MSKKKRCQLETALLLDKRVNLLDLKSSGLEMAAVAFAKRERRLAFIHRVVGASLALILNKVKRWYQ